MARPPLPVGTYGQIRCYRVATNRYRAMTKYRDYDGITRPVERAGRTATIARDRLRTALRDRGRADAAADITPDTKVAAVAELWFADIETAVAEGRRSPNTARLYRDRLNKQVIPALGELRVREITVARVDRLVNHTKQEHGIATAKAVRTVLSGLLGLAVRFDALTQNPVRDVSRIESNTGPARALTLKEAKHLRARIAADPVARARDVPDFTDMMLATGLRIGETAAITWDAVDLDAATVQIRGTVIRIRGHGLVIKPKPKSRSGFRTLKLPSWAVEMLRARRGADTQPSAPVFHAPMGGLRDPSNSNADLREAFDAAGYPWVTSHVYRKTVATLMDIAGLSSRAAADQLGHAKVSMTQDRYMGRRMAETGAAHVLEPIKSPRLTPGKGVG